MGDWLIDDLSRLLASGASRRHLLKGVAVTVLGGLFAALPAATEAAKARGLGEICGTGLQCASGFCDTAQRPSRCACPPGTTPCGGHAGSPITCVPICQDGQYLHPYTCQCFTPPAA